MRNVCFSVAPDNVATLKSHCPWCRAASFGFMEGRSGTDQDRPQVRNKIFTRLVPENGRMGLSTTLEQSLSVSSESVDGACTTRGGNLI